MNDAPPSLGSFLTHSLSLAAIHSAEFSETHFEEGEVDARLRVQCISGKCLYRWCVVRYNTRLDNRGTGGTQKNPQNGKEGGEQSATKNHPLLCTYVVYAWRRRYQTQLTLHLPFLYPDTKMRMVLLQRECVC